MNVKLQEHRLHSAPACAIPDPESAELAAAGLRVTIVRVAVLRLVYMSDEPLQAVTAFQRLADAGYRFGLAAVYKTLREFELAGFVVREWAVEAHGNRRAAYSARERSAPPLRPVRLVCPSCKRESLLDDAVLSQHLAAALARAGIVAPGRSLLLHVAHCACL
jgi:Fe2+ or Zn2+ uptake regulation protein